MQFTCVMIGSTRQLIESAESWRSRGHSVTAVITTCPHVTRWAQREGVTTFRGQQEAVDGLTGRDVDYLFSIINHAITKAPLLALPKKAAINFHDSPLPKYAGFNATAWAILDGASQHAITWHAMTDDVDGGAIYLQQPIEITADDTAFTLAAKCFEAGVASFAELTDRITRGTAETRPQGTGARSFHTMSDRPDDFGVLDLSRTTAEVARRVRASSFGPEDNPFGLAKLWLGGRLVAVSEVEPAAGPAGTPTADGSSVVVATADGHLRLSGLFETGAQLLRGESAERARANVAGAQPTSVPAEQRAAWVELDKQVRKHERSWARALERSDGLVGLWVASEAPTSHGPTAQASTLTSIAPELADGSLAGRSLALSVLAALCARLGDQRAFALALDDGRVPAALREVFSEVVPCPVSVDLDAPFTTLRRQLERGLTESQQQGTFLSDLALRRPALLERLRRGERLLPRIGVRFVKGSGPARAEASELWLEIDEAARTARWVFDAARVSARDVAQLDARAETLLRGEQARPDTKLGSLPIVPTAEREQLERWNATGADIAGACVHRLIEAQVDQRADKTALVHGDDQISYAELEQRANSLAHRLISMGVGPDTLVAVCVRRSIEMVVSLVAIHKAGGAYVPLDPAYPKDRLAIMLEDSRAPVLITERPTLPKLPAHSAAVICVEDVADAPQHGTTRPNVPVRPEHLAYVIFTSGSTGRPKGVMIEHRNVANFFGAMDAALDHREPGVWLALTSISFDISVLELLWTLARGFEVVIHDESDRASLQSVKPRRKVPTSRMGFGLFYFAADASDAQSAYRLLIESAKYADANGFEAIWTPERHFHAFGGIYPNPAVMTAALSTVTKRIHLRAGSVVLPLHHPIRVAEEWSLVDNLSGGRVGLSFASGWHANDFALAPHAFKDRYKVFAEGIDTVLKLWRGEAVTFPNGEGKPIELRILPRPVQAQPPIWIASAGNVETFKQAGRLGANILTNMLGQDLKDLAQKIAAYREARREAGFEGDGIVSMMLHTFIGTDTEAVKAVVKRPFCNYLATSFDLVKAAPWAFPAFRQPSKAAAQDSTLDPTSFTSEDMQALMEHAFNRYFETAGLFGTPEQALTLVDALRDIGINEMACLVDFGVGVDQVLESLPHLARLRELANADVDTGATNKPEYSVAEQITRRGVTHMQCTPSLLRALLADPAARTAVAGLQRLLVGGEALPPELAQDLASLVRGQTINMYGPTETTVWSTTKRLDRADGRVTIGRPIANTVIRLLDARGEPVPIGVPGELCIGGSGVVRGYWDRPELTAERFVPDRHGGVAGERLYRTGDLARLRADGEIEFLGRLDLQVKVNGYRIELGEIEASLARHPAVAQNVVMARSDGPAGAELVAYVVPRGAADATTERSDALDQWRRIWDDAYDDKQRASEGVDPRFDISGWRSSLTGEAIDAAQMREWVDATVDRLRSFEPRRIVELGCGTGLLLYRLVPHCDSYTAIDFSARALERIRHELTPDEQRRVTLLERPAHETLALPEHDADMVVLNSVAQYFPSRRYLETVLERASRLVRDGGCIVVGDVRPLHLLEAFHTAVELEQSPVEASAKDVASRLARRVEREPELLLSVAFFERLREIVPRLTGVEVELKRGRASNEMTRFRCDVVLRIGGTPTLAPEVVAEAGVDSLDEVRRRLAQEPTTLWLTDVPNARVRRDVAVARALAGGAPGTLAALIGASPTDGIDAEDLYTLDPRYRAHVRWAVSGAADRMDVLLCHRSRASGVGFPALDAASTPRLSNEALPRLSNEPRRADDVESLVPEWRAHLREGLPEYMIPATFVVLPTLPLTPNGKVDRKALPAPVRERPRTEAYVPPSNDLERTVAEVWATMLGVERVGLSENLFDLGANSLLTVQANNRLSQILGRKVPLVSMFRFPTVASLAAHLAQSSDGADATAQAGVERAEKRKDAAQTRAQARAQARKMVRE